MRQVLRRIDPATVLPPYRGLNRRNVDPEERREITRWLKLADVALRDHTTLTKVLPSRQKSRY